MELLKFEYIGYLLAEKWSFQRRNLEKLIKSKNVVFFFYQGDKCRYIGETGKGFSNYCFRKNGLSNKQWFLECNRIEILDLGEKPDDKMRKTIANDFIILFLRAGHPLENKI